MWSLFHAALDLAPERRTAFLGTACGGDGTLRRQVSELLASHERVDGPLDRTPTDVPLPTPPAGGADRRAGRRVPSPGADP
jgi:hypothetical protein